MGLRVRELTANEWVFLTLCAGSTLQEGDKVVLKKDLAERTLKELGDKVTESDDFQFDFVDGDVATGSPGTITETAHGMSDGQEVQLSNSGGALPTGLSAGVSYFVVNSTANTFQLETSVGGGAIDITAAAGGGTHTVEKLEQKLEYSTFEITRA